MAGEPQFTPEVVKQLAHIVANPEIVQTDARVESARQKHQVNQSEEGLQVLSGEILPSTRQDDESVLLNKFSSTRSKTGEKVTPTEPSESRWLRESKRRVEKVRDFLETGQINDQIVADVRRYLESNSSVYSLIFKELGAVGGDVNTYVRGLIENNPSFKKDLRGIFVERMNPSQRFETEAEIRDLERHLAEQEAKLTASILPAEITRAEKAVQEAKSKLEGSGKGKDLIEIETRQRELDEMSEDVSIAKQIIRQAKGYGVDRMVAEVDNLNTELRNLNPTAPDYTSEKSRIENELVTITSNTDYKKWDNRYRASKSIVDNQNELIGQIARLKTKLGPLNDQFEASKAALEQLKTKASGALTPEDRKILEAQIAATKAELWDARVRLLEDKMRFYRGITNMSADAAQTSINGAFTELKQLFTESAGELKSQEDQILAGCLDKIPHYYKTQRIDRKSGAIIWQTDRNFSRYWSEAYLNNGETGVEQALMNQIMPGGVFNEAGLRLRGFNDTEINALRNKFSTPEGRQAFLKENANKIGVTALADWLSAGGKLSEGIINSLVTTTKGQELLTSLQTRIGEIQQFKAAGEQLKTTLNEAKKGGKEWMKKNWWKIGLALMALILLLGLTKAA